MVVLIRQNSDKTLKKNKKRLSPSDTAETVMTQQCPDVNAVELKQWMNNECEDNDAITQQQTWDQCL